MASDVGPGGLDATAENASTLDASDATGADETGGGATGDDASAGRDSPATACGDPAPPSPPAGRDPCPASSCGNGRVDSCPYPTPFDAAAQIPASETCDGTDLGSRTCAGLGFADGTLACTPACALDWTQCNSCVLGPQTISCGQPAIPAIDDYGFAIASSSTELAVVWDEDGYVASRPRVHFTRLAPDFSVLSDTPCLGEDASDGVSVASAPWGWVATTGSGAVAQVISLDSSGRVIATRSLQSTATNGYSERNVQAVSGGSGDPLLVWLDGTGTPHAQLVGMDTTGAGVDVVLPGNQAQLSAAFVGDGFELVLFTIYSNSSSGGQLMHVALDGTLRMDATLAGQTQDMPQVAWSGSDIRVVTYPGSGALSVTSLTQAGADAGVVSLPYAWVGAMLPVGADTVLLEVPGNIQAAVTRFAQDGGTVFAPSTVIQAPDAIATLESLRMVQQGGDAIVAWVEAVYDANTSTRSSRLRLARVRLTP